MASYRGASWTSPLPCDPITLARPLHLVRQQDRLGDLAHRFACVHAGLADAMERISLTQTQGLHEDTLGALDHLAGLQGLTQVADFTLQGTELIKTRDGELDHREQLRGAERLDHIADDSSLARPLDQGLVGVGGEEHNW